MTLRKNPSTIRSYILSIACIGAIYFITARFSLIFAFEQINTSPVWFPSGIGLLAILNFGLRLWPSILIPVFIANMAIFWGGLNETNLYTIVSTSLGISLGSTLESIAGALLIQRFIKNKEVLARGNNVFVFIIVVAASCLISSLIGPLTLCVSGFAPWSIFDTMAFTWWMGDFSGILVVVPIFLSWRNRPFSHFKIYSWYELLASATVLFLFCMVIFFNWFDIQSEHVSEYLVIPVLLWIAYRYHQQISTVAIAITLCIAIFATSNGNGPFAKESINTSLILI